MLIFEITSIVRCYFPNFLRNNSIYFHGLNRIIHEMFEDDMDIDEILDSLEPTTSSLKRSNFEFQANNCGKRPKTEHEDAFNTSTTTTVKKIFRFKKKEPLPNEVKTIEVIHNVSNAASSPVAETDCKFAGNKSSIEELPDYKNETNSSFENKKPLDHTIQGERSLIKRRFPGPAGLLPERNLSDSIMENSSDFSRIESEGEICSQSSLINFSTEHWEKMESDFKTKEISLVEKYNVQWIKNRTSTKKLINRKAPFLAAFVDNIRNHCIQNPIVNLVMKDKTGTIQGTILHDLYEEHSGNLTVGSVIVLRDVGVLNTGPNDEPYLTITRNNLISIYGGPKGSGDCLSQGSSDVSKVVLQNLSVGEILDKISEMEKALEIEASETCNKNFKGVSVMNKDTRVVNLNDSFRKVVRNVKINKTPNLEVLRIKSTVCDNSEKSWQNKTNNPSCSSKENDKIDDLMNFFGSQEGIDEFFDDEPNLSEKTANKGVDPKTETCNNVILENSKIFEDAFEGVDASALFDEF